MDARNKIFYTEDEFEDLRDWKLVFSPENHFRFISSQFYRNEGILFVAVIKLFFSLSSRDKNYIWITPS
jgi:hypothetical protein